MAPTDGAPASGVNVGRRARCSLASVIDHVVPSDGRESARVSYGYDLRMVPRTTSARPPARNATTSILDPATTSFRPLTRTAGEGVPTVRPRPTIPNGRFTRIELDDPALLDAGPLPTAERMQKRAARCLSPHVVTECRSLAPTDGAPASGVNDGRRARCRPSRRVDSLPASRTADDSTQARADGSDTHDSCGFKSVSR